MAVQTLTTDPPAELAGPPVRLAEGVELVGPYQGSGYRVQRYVVVRGDGQVVQVSELLYHLASAIDGRSGPADLARRVGEETGRALSAADVDRLVHDRLLAAGLVENPSGPSGADRPAPAPRPDHLLMLRFRLPVVPAGVSWMIAGLFRVLHRPVVVAPLLAAVLALDLAVLLGGGTAAALDGARQIVANPTLVLLVLGSILAAGAFHECGHVSACRYGGARPGVMGVGIYLVWPAFYSTVTDSYRLSRAGRLRTDLGGVYFNAIVLGTLAATWLATGADWLLVVLAVLHLETVRQFLPMIRFDGYYILSDLVGVPDLFSYLGPVLRGWLPGAAPDPKLDQLRAGVRRTVRLWVAAVVPVLVIFLGGFLLAAPHLLPEVLAGARGHLADAAAGLRDGAPVEATLGAARAVLLVLPVVGVALVLGLVLRTVSRPLVRRLIETRATTDRGIPVLVAVLLPVMLLGTLVAVAAGPEADAAGPGGPGERQIAALAALSGGTAPVVGVLLGGLTALLLWPLSRRIGLPVPIAGLAVVLAGVTPPLVVVYGMADPAAPAATWLVVAALLAGRGPAAARGAYLACALAVITAPVAAVPLAAFVAHAVWARQLGFRLRSAGRWAVTVLGTVVAAAGSGLLAGLGGTLPDPGPGLLALVVAGLVTVLLTVRFRRPLAPVASGAVVLLCLVLVPATRTAAMLLLGPVLAMLGAGLADRALSREHPVRAGGALATTVLVLLAASGPVVAAAASSVPGPGRVAPVAVTPAPAPATSTPAGEIRSYAVPEGAVGPPSGPTGEPDEPGSGVAPEAAVPLSVVAPADG